MRWEKKKEGNTSSIGQPEAKKEKAPESLYLRDKTNYDTSKIKNIADLLHQIGDIPSDVVKSAIEEAKQTGKFVGEILVQKGIISQNNLLALLIKQCRIPLLSILSYSIDKSIIKLIPPEVCEKYKILPLDKMGDTVTLAMVDPLDREAITTAKNIYLIAI